jgi:hypothetical protein
MDMIHVLVGDMPKLMASMIMTMLSDANDMIVTEDSHKLSDSSKYDVVLSGERRSDIDDLASIVFSQTKAIGAIKISNDGLSGQAYRLHPIPVDLSGGGKAALIQAIQSVAGRD